MKKFAVVGSILVLVFLVFATHVQAAWAPAGLQGENVRALAEDPGEAAAWYAGTYTVGIDNSVSGDVYKYTDAAGWVLSSDGLPVGYGITALAVDPVNTNNVYAGLDGDGAYKSSDGGLTWASSGLSGLSVRDIAVDAYNPSILFAATDSGIYRSVDSGVNWTVVVSAAVDSSDIRKIALEPADLTQSLCLPRRT